MYRGKLLTLRMIDSLYCHFICIRTSFLNSLAPILIPMDISSFFLFKQVTLEKKIEAALVDDGYPRERVLEKRHAIRGFLFYPRGTAGADVNPTSRTD